MFRNCIFLLLFVPASLAAQDSSQTIPKKLYSQIFNQYYLNQKVFNGIIDSTDSWFSVFQDTVFQSQFDSICLRNSGKTWHRGQRIDCNTYLVVNEVYPYEWKLGDDSAELDTALVNRKKYLDKKGLQLWVCFGEFFMNEDTKSEYCGRFTGSFQIYFLWDSVKIKIFVCTNNSLPPDEPAVFFYGYWHPIIHKELPNLAYFWANTPHKIIENEGSLLPDLRIQPDGSQSFTNMAEFSQECMKPSHDWYKTIPAPAPPKPTN